MLSRLLEFFKPRPKLTGLALLQEKTQKLLWSGLPPHKIKLVLLADKELAPFHDYIRDMEDDMLAVGSELARKWSTL